MNEKEIKILKIIFKGTSPFDEERKGEDINEKESIGFRFGNEENVRGNVEFDKKDLTFNLSQYVGIDYYNDGEESKYKNEPDIDLEEFLKLLGLEFGGGDFMNEIQEL